MKLIPTIVFFLLMAISGCQNADQNPPLGMAVETVDIAKGWAKSPVNVAIHRKHSLVSFDGYQYVGFYNDDAQVVLGKRLLTGDQWELHTTPFVGNAVDPHNTINLMVDGSGYLHMAWDHHVHPLRYAISVAPGSITMSEPRSLLGLHEDKVTYPEFHPFPNGDILMAYRHGFSGNGVMVLNRYDHQLQQWIRLHDVLLDGEGQRNAYWQLHIDPQANIHLSWVWRETNDVATNHDMMYARSTDGGETWQRSTGETYSLPLVQANAEVVWTIPQNSNLMNQTSMTTDSLGHPWIASYWRDDAEQVTQIRAIWFDGLIWNSHNISDRTTDFSLGGTGSRITPLSRPLILSDAQSPLPRVAIIYRDSEADDRVTMTTFSPDEEPSTVQLNAQGLGRWEPTYDVTEWQDKGTLHLLLQAIIPPEDDTPAPAEMLRVLSLNPF